MHGTMHAARARRCVSVCVRVCASTCVRAHAARKVPPTNVSVCLAWCSAGGPFLFTCLRRCLLAAPSVRRASLRGGGATAAWRDVMRSTCAHVCPSCPTQALLMGFHAAYLRQGGHPRTACRTPRLGHPMYLSSCMLELCADWRAVCSTSTRYCCNYY